MHDRAELVRLIGHHGDHLEDLVFTRSLLLHGFRKAMDLLMGEFNAAIENGQTIMFVPKHLLERRGRGRHSGQQEDVRKYTVL